MPGIKDAMRATGPHTPARRYREVTSCLVVTPCHYLPRARVGVADQFIPTPLETRAVMRDNRCSSSRGPQSLLRVKLSSSSTCRCIIYRV
jgi:hypothetical protein